MLNESNKNIQKIYCPLCSSKRLKEFYKQKNMPVHTNLIYNTYEKAISCTKSNILLNFCNNCGLIFNHSFDEKLLEYNKNYNNDQFSSDYYKNYINTNIKILQDKHQIKNKKILEIGSGTGKYLKLFCKKTNSKGIGIDPAYKGEKEAENVSFISDYFSNKYSNIKADILILRHILEHIEKPNHFLSHIIKNINTTKDLMVIIEVPDFEWILRHNSYWDITYEHCNYFTKDSLKNLLVLNQIQVIDIFNVFQGQYIIIVGKFNKNLTNAELVSEGYDMNIINFSRNVKIKKEEITRIIHQIKNNYFTVWGISGKGVTFINMLDEKSKKRIPFVIDINNKKQDKYVIGTGHRIVSPSLLVKEKLINDIIIMNPNYQSEISTQLKSYGRKFNLIKI